MKKDLMVQQLLQSTDGAAPSGNDIEVCFSFDTTVSMYSCLEEVRARLQSTITRLLEDIPGIRIAVIAHGDYDTMPYQIKHIDFSSNIGTLTTSSYQNAADDECLMNIVLQITGNIVNFVNHVEMTTGRTVPEAYELALNTARSLSWTPSIKSKAFVMIGDSIPNLPGTVIGRANVAEWEKEAAALVEMGVKIYSVQALPEALKKNVLVCEPAKATKFWTTLAEKTNGVYLQLRQFGVITEVFLEVCYRQAAESQLGTLMVLLKRSNALLCDSAIADDKRLFVC
jgi:hypothetical protein